ncbi:RCC1 domain-containing protein [Candidatus Poriferisodalis sp.]|uniref:RCC1 domain-containing protein n=1 Tax=Candidatus Poriferisodalis sp. TaxID=3101277 RepID=UPI003B02E278
MALAAGLLHAVGAPAAVGADDERQVSVDAPIVLSVATRDGGVSLWWSRGAAPKKASECETSRYWVYVYDSAGGTVAQEGVAFPGGSLELDLTAGAKYKVQVYAYSDDCTQWGAEAKAKFRALAVKGAPQAQAQDEDQGEVNPLSTTTTAAPTTTTTTSTTTTTTTTTTPTTTTTTTTTAKPSVKAGVSVDAPVVLNVVPVDKGASLSWTRGTAPKKASKCATSLYWVYVYDDADKPVLVKGVNYPGDSLEIVDLALGGTYKVDVYPYSSACGTWSSTKASATFTASKPAGPVEPPEGDGDSGDDTDDENGHNNPDDKDDDKSDNDKDSDRKDDADDDGDKPVTTTTTSSTTTSTSTTTTSTTTTSTTTTSTSTTTTIVPQTGNYRDISTSYAHACALRTDSTVKCWGINRHGEADAPSGTFKAITTGGEVSWWPHRHKSIAYFAAHSCGIRTDDTIECWGANNAWQSTEPHGKFKAVSAGSYHTCAISMEDRLICWGGNDYNQAPGLHFDTYKAVSAGASHTCAIKSDDTLKCWGGSTDEDVVAEAPTGKFKAVSAGTYHTCAVRMDNTMACWSTHTGFFGRPPGTNVSTPSGTFTAVAAGHYGTCAVRTDGSVGCFKNDGSLTSWASEPSDSSSFTTVATAYEYMCAVKNDASLHCWGHSHVYNGKMTVPSYGFREITSGFDHFCGIRRNHKIACWNDFDDTVDGGSSMLNAPAGKFTAIAAGDLHTCAIRRGEGTLACWGANDKGQSNAPSGRFTDIAAGRNFTCAIRQGSGTVACWGNNPGGTLLVPTGKFKAVSAGYYHACAIRLDGSVKCWAWEEQWPTLWLPESPGKKQNYGFEKLALGYQSSCGIRSDDTIHCWSRYSEVAGKFTDIAKAHWHVCSLRTDGTVYCWGNGYWSELDPPSTSFKALATTRHNTCGIRSTDKKVECWQYTSPPHDIVHGP